MTFLYRFQQISAVSFKPRTRRHLGLTRSLFVHTVNCPLGGHRDGTGPDCPSQRGVQLRESRGIVIPITLQLNFLL